MKSFFCFLLPFLFSTCVFGQQFEWVRNYGVPGGNQYDVRALTMATDKEGNVYTAGYYNDTLKFDSSNYLNYPLKNNTNNSNSDLYLTKYDSIGNLIWVKGMPSSHYCLARSMAIDSSGNIYLTGEYAGKVDFDPDSTAEYFLGDTLNIYSQRRAFICKLSSQGDFMWVKSFQQKTPLSAFNSEYVIGFSVAIDKSQNVVVSGYFLDTVDFDPGPDTFYLSPQNFDYNTFFVKLKSDGSFKWATNYPFRIGWGHADLKIDELGNIYTAGVFEDSLKINVDTGTIKLNAINSRDNFITKLDSNGQLLWINSIGSLTYNFDVGIELDQFNNLYFLSNTGLPPFYYNSTKISSNFKQSGGTLLCKINSNGNLENARLINNNGAAASDLVLNKEEDRLYVFGRFFRTTEFFFDSTTTFYLNGSNTIDVYVYCLDLEEDSSWVKGFGGEASEVEGFIKLDDFDNIYSLGYFKDTVDFNPGTGTEIRIPIGKKDIFLHKLSPCTIQKSSTTDTICGGDSLVIGRNVYKKTGNYVDAYESYTGCDSLVTTALFVRPLRTDTAKFTICDGDSVVVDGQTYKTAGIFNIVYSFTNSCDSIFVVMLQVDSVSFTSNKFTICEGDSISVANSTYKNSGNYQDTLQATNGCDSIISTELTVNPRKFTNQNAEICEGESFVVGTSVYNTSGNYTDTLISNQGCDSIVSTVLLVKPRKRINQTVRLCFGETLKVGNTNYSTSGTYVDTLIAASGCDSIVNTSLTIGVQIKTSQSLSLCAADSVVVGNRVYQNSGSYFDTLTSVFGCDSLVSTMIEKIDLTFDSTGINLLYVNQQLADYQWLDCLNNLAPIIGETNQSISIDSIGVFAVEVSYENCKDTSYCIQVRFEEINAESFLIYPNPTSRILNMVFPTSGGLKMYDSEGRLVLNQNFSAGKNQLQVDFLSSGFYILKFESKFGPIFEKLVVSK